MIDLTTEDRTYASMTFKDSYLVFVKKQPNINDLKRNLIKLELDLQLTINKRNEAIFNWENDRRKYV